MDRDTREELRGLCRDAAAFRRVMQIFAAHYPGCGRCRQRYRLVFDNAPVGSLISDREGRIVSANPSLARMTGRSVADLEGSDALALVQEDCRDRLAAAYAGLWNRERASLRLCCRYRGPDGADVWGETSVDPLLDEDDFVLLMLTMITDLTPLRRAEREAVRQRRRLVQTEKMAALGTLIAGVAHEINKPNNVITMNAGRLRQAWDDVRPVLDEYHADNGDFLVAGLEYSRLRDSLDELNEAVTAASLRIKHIVHDLLGFGRPRAADSFGSVEINGVVMEAVDQIGELADSDGRHLELALAEAPPPVSGCPRRLTQVVVNLIQNALQALPEGGGRVRVGTAVADGAIRLTVADDGSGIPADELEHVRDPFYTTKRDRGGTGLGLWLSSYIVDEHGGHLAIASTPGAGTTVTVVLPAERAAPEVA